MKLSFKPTSTLAAVRLMSPALRGEGGAVAGAIVCTVFLALLELARPWPIKLALDALLNADATGRERTLLEAALVVVAIAVSAGFVQLGRAALAARTGRKITARVRARVFEHILRLPFATQRTLHSGDLLTRVTGDVSMVRDLLFTTWVGALERVLVLAGTAVVLFVIHPLFALLVLAPLVPFVLVLRLASTKMRRLVRRQREGESTNAIHASESFRQLRLVKTLGAEAVLAKFFRRGTRNAERIGAKAAMAAARMGLSAELLTGAGLALLLWVGGGAVLDSGMDASILVVLVSYARSIYKPLRGLSKEGTRMAKATACAERIQELLLLDAPAEDAGPDIPPGRHTLVLQDAAHLHDGQRGLCGLSAELRSDELTVVVGGNGAGKSTLAALLLRLLPLHSGSMRCAGEEAALWSLRSWRARCAYVPQEIHLFGMTVRENLLLARSDADEAALWCALDIAQARSLVERLPQGLDTMLSEAGASLSGGEARRLMLARAALRDAALIVLDEPLAGIDPVARPAVIAAVRSLARGRCVVVITHEAIAELNADQQLTLDEGRLVHCERRAARGTS